MSATTDNQSQTVLTLGVQLDTMKQLKTCFSQEKDEVQTAIKKIAKQHGRDHLLEYANYLFCSNLESRYKAERSKYVASYKPIIELMVSGGMERAAVLGAMQIDEEEFDAITQKQPSKGAAKKLADIARLVSAK